MTRAKDILVVTTHTIEGLKIQRYLKPITAHVVGGTNMISDFFATFTDAFGGRSQTYQKHLNSLYTEAIERIQVEAQAIGANCVIGLNIDMDEISGKGKSMFMLTAIGTAVILEENNKLIDSAYLKNKTEIIGADKIINLKKRKEIIEKANTDNLMLDDEIWNFITINKVDDILSYLLMKYSLLLDKDEFNSDISDKYYNHLIEYLDGIISDNVINIVYSFVAKEGNERFITRLCRIIKQLNLLDLTKVYELLQIQDFNIRKRALRIINSDKQFYNKDDIKELQKIKSNIKETFIERGIWTKKKQILSSKEKDVWTCECGNSNNEANNECDKCFKNIYGFTKKEFQPSEIESIIDERIQLILELTD